ncbi:uncharacterized protein LOC107875432 isoform X2 [Capsicum annuum]|uniref:uncharacterized protein LOC107875432 isoform X2 n=1 Tax=Capsicum annuum TaxID=4072 RepID=UPI0007BF6BB5|nr:uncharacterized protein LOC107875432 isoform X2 [Capsicum annuum]
MDSDLRLLEISGEEDSLLTPLPDMDNNSNDFTSISNFISPFRGLEVRIDPVKSGCSSRRGFSNKENINTDKAEMPKLSVEPLHMKRKKRGGGCNLRKSLAWDRAFSTEEGVLDPIELSLLSGSSVNTCGEALFTINEEERKPNSNDSLHDASSVYLNSNKKSTYKGIRAVALKEENRKASSKLLATHNGRTISKSSGCSRPLSSASLKRPANMNHGKSAIKDSKLPKCQVSKPSCSLPTSSKSCIPRASHLKHQVTDSAVSIQKNLVLMSSSKKLRNSQEKAKADVEPLKGKSSSCILRGNDEKSPSKLQASTESSSVNKASNTIVEMNPDATLPSSRAHSSEGRDGCTPFALRLPHTTRTAVSSMPCLPAQAMKPSGLRRPSPSLGFFRQTKASDTHHLLKAQSSMCPLQRSGDLKPPETVARKEGKENLANLNCKKPGFESESSTASSKVIKTGLEGEEVERVITPSVIKKLDPVRDKFKDHVGNFDEKVPDHIKREEKKLQEAELLMKQHPPQTGKHEHIDKDFRDAQFPQANYNYNTQPLGLRSLEGGNSNEAEESVMSSITDGLICNAQYGNMINFSGEVMKEGYIGGCNNLPGRVFEKVKSFAVEDDGIFDNDKYIMKIKSNLSKTQRDLRNNGGGNCESFNLADSDFSKEKTEKSEVAYQHEDSHNLKEAFTSKQITDKAQTGDSVADVSSETLSDENCETNLGGLSIYLEHKSQGGNVLHSSGRSLSNHVCIDQSHDEQIGETGLSTLPCQPDESSYDTFDVTSGQTELEGNRITVVGEDPADIMCFSPVKITLPENCNHSSDEEFNCNKILANSTTCLEFGSSSSRTRDKMISDVPDSIGECGKPIQGSILELVDETETHNSFNCHSEGNLTSSMKVGSSSRGTQNIIGSGVLCPLDEVNKLTFKGMDEFEIQDSPNKLNDGNQIIKLKLGMLSPESLKVEESHMCSHADFIPSSPTELGNHKVVLESLHTPKLRDIRQANEVGKTTNALTSISQMEDAHTETHDNDAQLLPGKGPDTVVKECESSNAFENFRDAFPARQSTDAGGLESPSFLNQESSLIHGSGNDADELDVIHCVADRISYPQEIESLSLEADLSEGKSRKHTASATTDCTELVEGDQTSSRIRRKVVDMLNQDIVVKESETGKHSGSESSQNELCHGLEDTEQCTNDNIILPVKNTESCLEKGNLLILPPRDAVPFSDEWLAAMEAAGEDILAMKGGAVQNSPQEKSLPEPSPWSPVKKKNNQLGPYDCTKFHHNAPPES